MTPRLPLFVAASPLPGPAINCVPSLPLTERGAQRRTDPWIVNVVLRRAMPTQDGSAISYGYAWPHREGHVWPVAVGFIALTGGSE